MSAERDTAPEVCREWLALRLMLRTRGFRQADMRAANRACILEELEQNGPLSRSALARRLQLSRTTISHIVAELLSDGSICEDGVLPASESGGRRSTQLRLGDAERRKEARTSES